MGELPELKMTPQVEAVLNILIADKSDHWGFEIIKATGVKSGTLYPILARLERGGLVTSGWADASDQKGARRRYYRITGSGVKVASRAAEARRNRRDSRKAAPVRGPHRPTLRGAL